MACVFVPWRGSLTELRRSAHRRHLRDAQQERHAAGSGAQPKGRGEGVNQACSADVRGCRRDVYGEMSAANLKREYGGNLRFAIG
eukprot:129763-Pyramimonas_sp.AAC.1